MRTDNRYEGDIHPCLGKDCMQCETCIFDKPLEEVTKKLRPDETCNYCGYLIKQFKDRHDVIFNACCSKAKIETPTCTRPRTIDFRLTENSDIEKPAWCPKLTEEKEKSKKDGGHDMTYAEKRDRLKALPPQLDWSQLTPGKKYVIPSILKRKRKILYLKYKTEFTLVFNDIKEDGTITNDIINIFKTDIDTNFIVEYKNF